MKQTINLYVYMDSIYSGGTFRPEAYSCKLADTPTRICIGEQQIEIEIPDDFDPTAKQVAALQQQLEEVKLAYFCRVKEINARIASLQALNYEVPA